jgi:hypothetical protein
LRCFEYFYNIYLRAFARKPGLDAKTGKYTVNEEKSCDGGNAGRAGFGGEGGLAGELIIKETNCQKWIRCCASKTQETTSSISINNKNNIAIDNMILECSDILKPIVEAIPHRIKCAQGNTQTHGELNVRGGEAGEAGTYGRDHVIYVSGKNQ